MDTELLLAMIGKLKSGEKISNEENAKVIAMVFFALEKEDCLQVIQQGVNDPELADLVWQCMTEVLKTAKGQPTAS